MMQSGKEGKDFTKNVAYQIDKDYKIVHPWNSEMVLNIYPLLEEVKKIQILWTWFWMSRPGGSCQNQGGGQCIVIGRVFI